MQMSTTFFNFFSKKVLYFIAKRVKIIEKRYIFLEKTEKDVTIKNGEKMKNNSVFK